jgi:VanZ family protein
MFVPGRCADPWDVVCDGVGAGLALAICVLTGCLDEAIQYLHPQRVGDLADAALNAASAAVAILALLCLEPDRPRPTSAK